MQVGADCETLNNKDILIFRFFLVLNKNVVLSCFWQLARHWKEGNADKLELACKNKIGISNCSC